MPRNDENSPLKTLKLNPVRRYIPLKPATYGNKLSIYLSHIIARSVSVILNLLSILFRLVLSCDKIDKLITSVHFGITTQIA